MAQPIFRRPLLLIGVLAAVSGPVHAQQPPDVVQSDPTANTAMGTNALFFNTSSGSRVTGSAVYASPYGQLGVMASSERYKTDIASMGSGTARLDQLRPVTFRLKNETQGPRQYGLIAEEVEMQLQVARVMELERTVRVSLMKSQYENRRAGKL